MNRFDESAVSQDLHGFADRPVCLAVNLSEIPFGSQARTGCKLTRLDASFDVISDYEVGEVGVGCRQVSHSTHGSARDLHRHTPVASVLLYQCYTSALAVPRRQGDIMTLRPKLMNGKDLDTAVTAAAQILNLRGRCGELESTTERELEKLLDEAAIEQAKRHATAASDERVGPSHMLNVLPTSPI